jgi:hypothetical protein
VRTAIDTGRQQAFETFSDVARSYLMNIHDDIARVYGVRYMAFLQSVSASDGTGKLNRPHAWSPAHTLVRLELDRIFERHYGFAPRSRAARR